MYAMTAAHPTLPLPSYARVTGVASGKSVIVRVNDRGPFLHGRVIDLSFAAAERIGIAQKGSGEVEVEAILPAGTPLLASSPPLPPVALAPSTSTAAGIVAPVEATVPAPVAGAEGGFVVQLGAFANFANAQNFVAHLANQLGPVGVEANVRQVNGLFRVFAGPYPTRDDAKRTADPSSAASAVPPASFTSATTTRAPLATSMRAVAAPRPDAPPVTKKTLSVSCNELLFGGVDGATHGVVIVRQIDRSIGEPSRYAGQRT